jgi:chromosome segregation ATPase
LTYPDLAEALQARIYADLEAEKVAHAPRNRPDPDERRRVEALEAHIATLQEAVAKTEAVGEQRRQEAETAVKRADALVAELVEMTGELVEMSTRMATQTAAMDKVPTELDDHRARS